jgi:preprotein translocase subunit SecG
MYSLISVLIMIACILLVLIVLVQSSKGGGLASNFSASSQILGVRKTADFLEKATWTLASSLLLLSLLASISVPRSKGEETKSRMGDQVDNAIDPDRITNFPTTVPEQSNAQNDIYNE